MEANTDTDFTVLVHYFFMSNLLLDTPYMSLIVWFTAMWRYRRDHPSATGSILYSHYFFKKIDLPVERCDAAQKMIF